MFIEKFKNNGIDYLRLVEGLRITDKSGKKSIRKKVIFNIGPLSKYSDGSDDYISRLKESYKKGNPIIPSLEKYVEKKTIEDYKFTITENSPDCFGHPKLFSNILIEKILENIGVIEFINKNKYFTKIRFDLIGFFRLLLYGRILNPTSKIASLKQNNDYYQPICDIKKEDNVYDTLSFLYKYKKGLISKINKSLIDNYHRTTDIVYYDVTNFYFEIDEPDQDEERDGVIVKGIRKYGVSKEERKLPIIQMGLFMDDQGIPISIKTFPGNTLDHLTVSSALKSEIDDLELSRFIFVGDRGMCSYKNLSHLLDNGNGYVVSKSIEKTNGEEKKWIYDNTDFIEESPEFKYKEKIINRTIVDENNKKRIIVEKVVIYWSKSFADRQKAEQKSFIEFLNKVIETPSSFRITNLQYRSLRPFLKNEVMNNKTGEIIKSSDVKALIDSNKVNEYINHMGYYQIISSETNKSAKEIIDIYHGLSRIEDQFRLLKGDLNARPTFVWTPEHLEAHFLLCTIALIVLRIIQNKIVEYRTANEKNYMKNRYWRTGLSGERIIKALNEWTVDMLPNDYYRFNNINNADLKLILNSFNINIKPKLYRLKELKHIKQTI